MATTMVNGIRRVTLPEDVGRDLGLEDGVEYVVERSGSAATPPSVSDRRDTTDVIGSVQAHVEQIEALERMLASRRRFPNARLLTDDDSDEAIAEAIVEDFRSGDHGDDAGIVGTHNQHHYHHTNRSREVLHGRHDY